MVLKPGPVINFPTANQKGIHKKRSGSLSTTAELYLRTNTRSIATEAVLMYKPRQIRNPPTESHLIPTRTFLFL
ncbi:hypothetical protein CCACVL1_31060 [Corchorus capsularis]|uniref:Uncharacterized protein n=1 Tax=Corchorus capsularis TaxID=210143 RepID=A0A1R3FU77_COCAP|nr:hypothetical protein CCACVL1_31060 [Corchorus capsularis]